MLKTLLIRSEHNICVYTIQWIHHCSWGFNFCQFLRSLLNTNLHPPKNKFKDMNCLKCLKNQRSYRYTKKLGLHKPERIWLSTNIDPHAFKWYHRIPVYLIVVTQGWSRFVPLSVMMKRGTKLNQLWVPTINIPITLSNRFNTNIHCILGMQR